MQTLPGTLSSWAGTAHVPTVPSLSSDCATQVCVIGAGIAGLTTAYMLLREGRDVIVIDAMQPGAGESGRTSAHLCSANDDGFVSIEKLHGAQGARLAYMSHAAAIDMIEEIAGRENIDCDFRRVDGHLFQGDGKRAEILDEEFDAAHRAGMRDVEKISQPLAALAAMGRSIRFPEQAQFHPVRYMAGLMDAITKRGGRIYSDAHVLNVTHDNLKFAINTAAGHHVHAHNVVVATNSPITTVVAIHTKQAAYRTYVVAFRIPRGSVPIALYWDTDDPYHYARVQELHGTSREDLLIVGGEDHKTGQDENHHGEVHFLRLHDWARTYFPMSGAEEFRWSGQVHETVDNLAFIGRNPGGPAGLYIATGDSGMGLTHGTIAGMILSDQITGRVSPWEDLYNPSRVSVSGIGKWVRENLNVMAQYKDYAITPGKEVTIEDIIPGAGGIIIENGHRIAAYRDAEGELHRRSAVCTHLGGIVHWNPVEKTWDCPCHGSRFSTDGNALNGPTTRPLPPPPDASSNL